MMTRQEMQETLGLIKHPNMKFELMFDDEYRGYLRVTAAVIDVLKLKATTQNGRWWRLSPNMVPSELVQTAFKAVLTWQEHEAREHFTYKGQKVLGPHLDLDLVAELLQEDELRESVREERVA